jgi:hypothetical protein
LSKPLPPASVGHASATRDDLADIFRRTAAVVEIAFEVQKVIGKRLRRRRHFDLIVQQAVTLPLIAIDDLRQFPLRDVLLSDV